MAKKVKRKEKLIKEKEKERDMFKDSQGGMGIGQRPPPRGGRLEGWDPIMILNPLYDTIEKCHYTLFTGQLQTLNL